MIKITPLEFSMKKKYLKSIDLCVSACKLGVRRSINEVLIDRLHYTQIDPYFKHIFTFQLKEMIGKIIFLQIHE